MIGKINIRVSAANPQMPLGPFYVFTGSAASFTICDIPLPLGVRKVEGVTVRAKNVDGETRGLAAVRVGSAWGATVPAGFFSTSGSVENGIVIEAYGTDESGQNVEPWIIGAGDMNIMLMDGSIEPGEMTHEMYWHDVKPTNPAAGDVCRFDGSVHYYNGSEWIRFSDAVTLDQSMPTEEPTTENGHGATVKAIWSWVTGLLSNLTIPWGRVTNVPQTFPPSSHNHTAGEVSGLATVATSGSYNDLQNKPAIPPAVTLDQSMPTEEPTTENGHGATVKAIWSWVTGLLSNLTIPWGRVTNVPQTFPPSSHNHTAGEVSGLATVATSGSYNDLQNKPAIPTVPTNVSAFTNDAGYIAANGAITVVKLTNANETMADILARIGSEAAAGRYPVFDTHTISDLKLCSISIDAAAGAVRLQDSVTGKIYVGPYSATEKIGQVLAKAVEEYVPITVTAATKDGVTVMGKTVYLHEGADATGRVVETAQYNGEPVTFKVGGGFRYFVRIDDLAGHFPPTTAAGVANAPVSVTLTYGDADHVTTFEEVKMAIDVIGDIATLKAKLIGGDKQINDTWTDLDATGDGDATPAHDADGHPIWNDPMVCTNVEMVEDADGVQHIAAIYMRKYATVNKIPFDAPNQEEATEETAQEGITYYGLTKGATSPSTSNVTVLTLAAGDAIPYATYEKVFKNAYNDSTKNIIVNGHNRYQTSAYRQYLCADKSVGAGLWWSRQHVGQVHPGADYMLHPYQAGCSAALLAAIKPVKRTVAANTKIDGGGTYQVCDPFWLPAHVEMFGKTDTTEGSTQEEYWHAVSGDPSKQPGTSAWTPRKQYDVKDKTTAVHVRLRSANVSNSYNVYSVYASGSINSNSLARAAYASVPACAIY